MSNSGCQVKDISPFVNKWRINKYKTMSSIPPELYASNFSCPNCKVYAQHEWNLAKANGSFVSQEIRGKDGENMGNIVAENDKFWLVEDNDRRGSIERYIKGLGIRFSICSNCSHLLIWFGNDIVYPEIGIGPPPNPDLDEVMLQLYNEASMIATKSPRAAAALLRVCLDNLCKKCGRNKETIFSNINQFIEEEKLDNISAIAASLIRIVGNDAVHDPDKPGLIIDADDIKTVEGMFGLVNIVADQLITQPRQREERLNQFEDSIEMDKAIKSVEKAEDNDKE